MTTKQTRAAPVDAYGRSKLAAEAVVRVIARFTLEEGLRETARWFRAREVG